MIVIMGSSWASSRWRSSCRSSMSAQVEDDQAEEEFNRLPTQLACTPGVDEEDSLWSKPLGNGHHRTVSAMISAQQVLEKNN